MDRGFGIEPVSVAVEAPRLRKIALDPESGGGLQS